MPFAVFLDADGSLYAEPDISVICDKGRITDEIRGGLQTKDVRVRRTGLRKLLANQACGWIVIYSFLKIGRQVPGSTGLLIR